MLLLVVYNFCIAYFSRSSEGDAMPVPDALSHQSGEAACDRAASDGGPMPDYGPRHETFDAGQR